MMLCIQLTAKLSWSTADPLVPYPAEQMTHKHGASHVMCKAAKQEWPFALSST